MADINKFTAKEVLNKVLLDSSGDAVVAFSHTSQEALNAALDTTNNRLNISLKGGTIDGDVSITGDLTITGSSTYTYDEQIDGQLWLKDSTASSSTQGGHLRLFSDDGAAMAAGHRLGVIEFAGAEDASSTITVGARIEALAESTYTSSENGSALLFYTTDGNASQSEQMRITSDGNIGIGESSSVDKKIHIKSSSSGDGITLEQASTGSNTIRFEANSSALRALIGTEDSDGGSMFTNASGYAISIRSEAKIHLGTGGDNIRMTLDDNSRISLSNNDSAGTGGSDSTSGVTLLGYGAGNNIASGGVDNSFFGHGTGNRNTTGEKNSCFGNLAGFGNATGDHNTYVGYGSGWGVANNNNSNNTGVGFESLKAITTGGSNVAVGYEAGDLLTTGSNNTVIGDSAEVSANSASNQTVVGQGATGQADNSVTLGNASVANVYMAQDSGATVHAGGARIGSPTITSFATNIKASTDVLSLEADGAGGPQLRLTDTSSSSDDDTFSLIDFSAKDSGGTQTIMNRIASTIPDNSAGTVDTALSIYAKSNNTLTETVRIGSSRLYLPQGQIGFPATQNASSDANTLDDYEEGEHSATITCSSSGSYTMGTNNTLRYTKIGRLVHIQGLLVVTSESSPSGDIRINLPFTAGTGTDESGRSYGSCQIYDHGGTISGNTSVEVVGGNSFIQILEVEDDGDRNYLNEGDVDTGWGLGFDFTYSV